MALFFYDNDYPTMMDWMPRRPLHRGCRSLRPLRRPRPYFPSDLEIVMAAEPRLQQLEREAQEILSGLIRQKSEGNDKPEAVETENKEQEVMEVNGDKEKEVAEVQPQVVKKVARLSTMINVNEDLQKLSIDITLDGHKFEAEHLEVQVVDNDVLVVKAEDGDKKFERRFRLPAKANLDKIEARISVDKEKENRQKFAITVPKEVNVKTIPISMEE